MARKFDDFSKHLAKKHSRRSALRFLGAGVIGALTATIFTRQTDARPPEIVFNRGGPPAFVFNQTRPPVIAFNKVLSNVKGKPAFNHVVSNPAFKPFFNHTTPGTRLPQ